MLNQSIAHTNLARSDRVPRPAGPGGAAGPPGAPGDARRRHACGWRPSSLPAGPACTWRGNGYVDVADATGDPELSSLRRVLEIGPAALGAISAVSGRDGISPEPADFAPAVPEAPRILCRGVNYSEHAIEGGREGPTWPEAFVRG